MMKTTEREPQRQKVCLPNWLPNLRILEELKKKQFWRLERVQTICILQSVAHSGYAPVSPCSSVQVKLVGMLFLQVAVSSLSQQRAWDASRWPQWRTELDHLGRWMVGFPHLQRHFFFVIISNLRDDALCKYSMPNDPTISAS